MSYATKAGMIERFGVRELIELTDRGGAGGIDDAVLLPALADANDEVDMSLRRHYALPLLAPMPPVLARLACDLARFNLSIERATEEVVSRAEAARSLLAGIASGKVMLGLTAPAPLPAGSLGTLELAARSKPSFGMIQ